MTVIVLQAVKPWLSVTQKRVVAEVQQMDIVRILLS
jgi:hypothetical protein